MPVTYTHGARPLMPAILRGLMRRCPACGKSRAFAGYLKLVPECGTCGTALGQIRADDFPPYLTIFAVGHIVVPLVLLSEQTMVIAIEVQMAIWPLLTLLLSLAFLPVLKGGVVGMMWALHLRGGDEQPTPEDLKAGPERSQI